MGIVEELVTVQFLAVLRTSSAPYLYDYYSKRYTFLL